ncbi:MAG: YeeE/YedE family protein [Prolixibacteraceae bacterium]|nr:YeeE/YedE family protein [Prolixibacteraceae bacterium]
MGPLSIVSEFPEWLNLLIAFFIGIGFGFALEQAGFSSSRRLAGMFYGYDTTVLKVFFTAAIVALAGSQLLSFFGLLNLKLVFVNPYYANSAILGGIIMGAGFIMGGYCPGTGISAMSIGKIDAMVFLLGGMLGAFLFMETYPLIQSIAMENYKGNMRIDEWLGVSPGVFTLLLIIAAVAMFWIAELAEKKFSRPDITSDI